MSYVGKAAGASPIGVCRDVVGASGARGAGGASSARSPYGTREVVRGLLTTLRDPRGGPVLSGRDVSFHVERYKERCARADGAHRAAS